MSELKVRKIGNSLGVTLPSSFVKEKRLKAGQKVFVEADSDMDMVQIRSESNRRLSITPEFKQWLDDVSEKYEDVIKELAKR